MRSKNERGNYRPISLLPIPGKVFAKVRMLVFNHGLTYNVVHTQQSGFTACRNLSTIGAILALRLMSEIDREFERSLNMA